MVRRTFLEAAGVSSTQTKWSGNNHAQQNNEAGRRWYEETMRKLFPDAVIDSESAYPPFIVERGRVPENAGLKRTLKPGRVEHTQKPRTLVETFLDLAQKVPVGESIRFASCSVQRVSDGEITVTYLDSKISKTLKYEVIEHPDRTIQVVEEVGHDGVLRMKETLVKFKDDVAPSKPALVNRDPDFSPLTANMWYEYLRRTVQVRDGTFQIGREIHAFQRAVDHSKVGESNFRNLATKLAYLQRVRENTPQTVIEENLPILLNHIDFFSEE